ncbi:DNA helicase, phage-associated [Vibrio phage VCPH]|nr:DNA helicase, phage-associated [Vibrio phage VCPH]
MPNTRLDLIETFYQGKVELEIVDKRVEVPAVVPEPKFVLRDDQQEIVDAYVEDSILNGAPGFGKTISALALAYKLQQKTLVICTNVDIRKMWELEIEKWFGFSPSVIGSGRKEWDKPITVANIQTVRKLGMELSDQFGFLVVDEAHHCVAATFDYLVMQSKARYKLGLTGTLWRKDGLHVCFSNYFGRTTFKPKERNTIAPVIHRHRVPLEIPGTSQTPWALRINELYEMPEYRDKLKRLANAYAVLGHKVLLVTDRTELLNWLAEDNQVPSFLITGEVDDRIAIQKQVAECPTGCILAATQSIFAEGISLNALSCVILGAPTNNKSLVEQIVGRVQRIEDGKLSPVVVDLMLKGATGTRHARMRYNVYAGRGWECINANEKWLGQQINQLLS